MDEAAAITKYNLEMVLKLEEDGKLTLPWLYWMDWSKQWMDGIGLDKSQG